MLYEAREVLLREGPDGPSDNWKAVGQSFATLLRLVFSDDDRPRPDLVMRIPQGALTACLGENVIIADMTGAIHRIFDAVYNEDPNKETPHYEDYEDTRQVEDVPFEEIEEWGGV